MKKLPILMYHSIDASGSVVSVAPQKFAEQMDCLADLGFRGISLSEAVAFRQSNGSWPEQSVVLTFDDGYANFYDAALPVLMKHKFTSTVFVVSNHMGCYNDWEPPPEDLGTHAILSWNQAKELSASNIEIGAHTRTHPDLRRLTREAAEYEIARSRIEIEQHLGLPVKSFAYPFGNTDSSSLEVVKREFQSACTTILRRAGDDALHILPRIDMFYVRLQSDLERLLEGRS